MADGIIFVHEPFQCRGGSLTFHEKIPPFQKGRAQPFLPDRARPEHYEFVLNLTQ